MPAGNTLFSPCLPSGAPASAACGHTRLTSVLLPDAGDGENASDRSVWLAGSGRLLGNRLHFPIAARRGASGPCQAPSPGSGRRSSRNLPVSSGNSYRMGAKQQIYLQERSTRRPGTGLRLVCICTHCPLTRGHSGFLQTHVGIVVKEPAPWRPRTGCSPLTWMMSHAAAQICLPAPHPSSSHLSSCRRGENALPSVQLQSLTHYFYFSCRQAIAKIPTHQHIHCCKLSCPQPPEKKSLTPSSLQCAILQKDSKEEKGTASESDLGHQLTRHPGKKKENL